MPLYLICASHGGPFCLLTSTPLAPGAILLLARISASETIGSFPGFAVFLARLSAASRRDSLGTHSRESSIFQLLSSYLRGDGTDYLERGSLDGVEGAWCSKDGQIAEN